MDVVVALDQSSRKPKPYTSYQLSEDYYRAGQMIWLEADVLIRSNTGNRKSLDDFAKAFFGVDDDFGGFVITAGLPFGTPGATNLLRIAWVS